MTKRKKKDKALDILIGMYHNAPPLPMGGDAHSGKLEDMPKVWCNLIWDTFMITEALEEALGKKADKAIDKHFASILAGQHYPKDNADPVSWGDVCRDHDVYRLMGTVGEMTKLARRWALDIKHSAEDVGGDDSYFDYFPDYVGGFLSLCKALDNAGEGHAKHIYEDVYEYLRVTNGPYRSEDDAYEDGLIAEWEEQ